MIRSSHIVWPAMKLDYGFVYDIRSFEELIMYWLGVHSKFTVEGFSDFIKSKEFARLKGSLTGSHTSTNFGAVLATLVNIECNKDRPKSIIDILVTLENSVFCGMCNLLLEPGVIFVNENGGYFTLLPGHEILETRKLKKFLLPNSTVRIVQWPDGKHYYAKVGGEDVVVDGEQKWSTEEAAKRAAEQFLKTHQKG